MFSQNRFLLVAALFLIVDRDYYYTVLYSRAAAYTVLSSIT